MKDFILCQYKQAKIPFAAGAGEEPVYTLEELCFYMQGHLFLLDESFFGEELLSWLQNELGLTALASALRDMKTAEKDISDLIQKVFVFSGLYDREELNELEHMITTLQDKSAVERQVIYGDYLLSRKSYREALSVYLDLQKDGRFLQMSEELQKRVLYHTGVIYARFLLFAEAAGQFLELYRKYDDRKGLESWLMLKAVAAHANLPFDDDAQDVSYETEDLEAQSERLDRLSEDPASAGTQDTAREALSTQMSKDAWIRMLLKKYELVDSL